MDRRLFLAASSAAGLLASRIGRAIPPPPCETRWIVRTSEGFDALGFLAPLSGDRFYTRHHEKDVAEFSPRLPPQILADLRELKAEVAKTDGLLSPAFYLYFSGGRDETVDNLLASLDTPDELLRPSLRASPYWDEESWQRFLARRDRLRLNHRLDGGGLSALPQQDHCPASRDKNSCAEGQALFLRLDLRSRILHRPNLRSDDRAHPDALPQAARHQDRRPALPERNRLSRRDRDPHRRP